MGLDLEGLLRSDILEKMRVSRINTIARFGKKMDFYIPCLFPAISITGSFCALKCEHCGGKLLGALASATSGPELEKTALNLKKNGARGILITGGCDASGRVPVMDFLESIKAIKKMDLMVIAHTGFISKEEAEALEGSGLDGIAFDVVGDMETAKKVYGLNLSREDYLDSLRAIDDSDILVFPHVCVGLDHGRLRGEIRALELIREIRPSSVIITGLMPLDGTPMAGIKPDPRDFAEVIVKATELFPEVPITLGCARSRGRDREIIDILAIESGVSRIAVPTRRAVEYAYAKGYEVGFYGACCGIEPSMDIRISGLGVEK